MKEVPQLFKTVKDVICSRVNQAIEEVVCMWRFSKSNGITEGFHRKMKLIQRRAYGFKNFENYRTRVRVLCC
ncbi:transposase [Legionella erythra]|uniref:transposase n=1 Tax=Legionella erythra TaxID=448 RepID=UPI003BF87C3F